MISIEEAYQMAKKTDENKDKILYDCRDFGDCYGFHFIPKRLVGQKFGGCAYHTVNKSDGSISFFSPLMDMDKYMNAESIDINIFE